MHFDRWRRIHTMRSIDLSEKAVPTRTNLALSFIPGHFYVAFVAAAIIGSAWGYGAGSMFDVIFVGMPVFLSMPTASLSSLVVAWHEIDRSRRGSPSLVHTLYKHGRRILRCLGSPTCQNIPPSHLPGSLGFSDILRCAIDRS